MTDKIKSVYEKLQSVRVKLQQKDLKMTGNNAHLKASYFILKDFIPEVNALFNTEKLCSLINFTTEAASLTIVNSENPSDTIVFSMPMSSASLKGVHEVQNLGATITYQRKYLYLLALEIVEHDELDATTGRVDPDAEYNTYEKKWLDLLHAEASESTASLIKLQTSITNDANKNKLWKKHSKYLKDIASEADNKAIAA